MTYDKLVESVRAHAAGLFGHLKRVPYGKFLACAKRNLCGVYIIFDEAGKIVYVGKSTTIKIRLRAHLHASLFSYALQKAGVPRRIAGDHVCPCGQRIKCDGLPDRPNPAGAKLRDRILSEWSVAVLKCPARAIRKSKPILETFAQLALDPESGSTNPWSE